MLRLAVPALMLLSLSACATGPQERIARGEFACEDGRHLKVAFNLDQQVAEVRVLKTKIPPVLIPHLPGVHGRSYAGNGYSLQGVGDEITYVTPEGPAARCVETR